MDGKKLDWIKNYINLNESRKGKRMILDDGGRERVSSVVMSQNEFQLKVAIECEHTVCIKSLCLFDGNSEYHIPKEYFNMGVFLE